MTDVHTSVPVLASSATSTASPAQTYTFGFVDATSNTDVLDVPGIVLAAGHTYTIYLIGPSGQFSTAITQDR